MFATKALRGAAATLLAADASTLAPATDANKIVLVKAPFTPGEGVALGDLTLADFDGSTPILVGVGTQPTGWDPNNDDRIIDLKPPTTGFRWETTGTTNLPQTIYGFALVDNGEATVLASQLFDTPIALTAVDQRVDAGAPFIRQLANSMV